MPNFIATKTYCVNSDKSRIVPCDSPEAHYQLVAEGCELPEAEARKYGLLKPTTPEKAVEAEAEGGVKEVSAPPENKAVRAAQTQNKKANSK
jgi:hypothetical protein